MIVFDIVLIIFLLLIPPYFLSRSWEEFGFYSVVSFIFMPVVVFGVALVSGQLLSFWLVLGIALGICAICFMFRRQLSGRKQFLTVAILLFVFIFHFFAFGHYEEDGFNCADNWAYLTLDTPLVFGLHTDLNNSWTVTDLTNATLRKELYELRDIYPLHYRINENKGSILGNFKLDYANDESFTLAIHPSFFLALSSHGLRIFNALIFVFASYLLIKLLLYHTRNWLLALLGLALLNLSGLLYLSQATNRNIFSMLLLLFIIYVFVFRRNYWVGGLAYGYMVGLNPITLLLAPALSVFFYKRLHKAVPFGVGSLMILIPVYAIRYALYGSVIFEGFLYQPQFAHSILGLKFYIPTLLNFPFIPEIVRSPGFMYPMFIYLPLVLMSTFGLVLFSAIFLSRVRDYRLRWMYRLLPLFFVGFLMVNENWVDPKTTFLLVCMPVLVILALTGLQELINNRRITSFVLILALAFSFILIVKQLEFPVDERAYLIDRRLMHNELRGPEVMYPSVLPDLAFLPPSFQLNDAYFPRLLNKFEGCLSDGAIFSAYDVDYLDNTTWDVSHRVQGVQPADITVLDLRRNLSLHNISSPSGCYSFDLSVKRQPGIVNISLVNISSRAGNQVIAPQVNILVEGTVNVRVYEEGILSDKRTIFDSQI
ncbi:MAG: hypothetical protein ACQESG_00085 [Nanobdellota archaeon]